MSTRIHQFRNPSPDSSVGHRGRLDFRTVSIAIPTGKGRREIRGLASFKSRVLEASTALNAFEIDYLIDDGSRPDLEADIYIESVAENTVRFCVEFSHTEEAADLACFGYVTATVQAIVA